MSDRPAVPGLDIVIVAFNARADLLACLDSLHAAGAPPGHVVVVDNASADGAADAVAARHPSVRVVRNRENVGFASANNIGIRATAGELVLLLNSDTLVPAGAIEGLVRALVATPDAAAAGPRLVDDGGVPELSFGRMITPWIEARQKALQALHRRGFPPARALVRRLASRPRAVDWVSGACLLARRADLERVGLLDERFFMYTEDVDVCAAFRAAGRRVLYVPTVTIVHRRGRSRDTAPRATALAYRRSQLAFYAKHHPRWIPWLRAYLRIKGELPG